MDSFITIWIGYKFVLPTKVLLVLVINFFIVSSRSTYGAFKEAAGIFYEDRFVPIIESLLNIVLSIIFVKKFYKTSVFNLSIIIAKCKNLELSTWEYFIYFIHNYCLHS